MILNRYGFMIVQVTVITTPINKKQIANLVYKKGIEIIN